MGYRLLLDYNLEELQTEEDIDVFWLKIRDAYENGQPLFFNIGKFFLNILKLPLSVASVERSWSKWKTKKHIYAINCILKQ